MKPTYCEFCGVELNCRIRATKTGTVKTVTPHTCSGERVVWEEKIVQNLNELPILELEPDNSSVNLINKIKKSLEVPDA